MNELGHLEVLCVVLRNYETTHVCTDFLVGVYDPRLERGHRFTQESKIWMFSLAFVRPIMPPPHTHTHEPHTHTHAHVSTCQDE
jgi:hypothetical protein